MCSYRGNPALIENNNAIGIPHGGDPLRDQDLRDIGIVLSQRSI